MIETSGEGGSAWLTPPLGGINSSLKERERDRELQQWLCCTKNDLTLRGIVLKKLVDSRLGQKRA